MNVGVQDYFQLFSKLKARVSSMWPVSIYWVLFICWHLVGYKCICLLYISALFFCPVYACISWTCCCSYYCSMVILWNQILGPQAYWFLYLGWVVLIMAAMLVKFHVIPFEFCFSVFMLYKHFNNAVSSSLLTCSMSPF